MPGICRDDGTHSESGTRRPTPSRGSTSLNYLCQRSRIAAAASVLACSSAMRSNSMVSWTRSCWPLSVCIPSGKPNSPNARARRVLVSSMVRVSAGAEVASPQLIGCRRSGARSRLGERRRPLEGLTKPAPSKMPCAELTTGYSTAGCSLSSSPVRAATNPTLSQIKRNF